MDITPVKFNFKYNPAYRTIAAIALTGLVIVTILILWSLLHGFTWHRAISAFIFALLLSSFFNDLPRHLVANHDGITIKKFIGSAKFSISEILGIQEPDPEHFKIKFYGAGYISSLSKRHLISTYLTQKTNILILETTFGHSKLYYAISCPDNESKQQLLNYMNQIRQYKESKEPKEA